MSFSGLNTVRKIVAKLPKFQLQELRGDIFGQLPILNVKTGANQLRKTNTGYYIARYYLEPIEKAARLATPGLMMPQQQRRAAKLEVLRRRGKGPPKKGSGKRSKNKK